MSEGARETEGGQRSRLYGLQYLRAVAASGVLLFHAAGRYGWSFSIGEAGVDLFFVLSGFLMIAITSERSSPAAFFADRVRRIVPTYWFATTVMVVGLSLGLFRRVDLDIFHVVTSYLFLPYGNVPNGRIWPVLVPGWTLNFEMMFYLLFAATMVLRHQVYQVAVLAVLFCSWMAFVWASHLTATAARFYAYPIVLEFVLGCWLGLAWKGAAFRRAGAMLTAVAGAAVAASIMLAALRGHPRTLVFGVPAACLVGLVLLLERRGLVASRRLPLLIGDASYSIYLWHVIVVSLAVKIVAPLHLPAVANVALSVLSALAAGVAAYFAVERPVMRFFRERRFVRGVPVPAGP